MGDGRGPAPERAQLDALLRWREENARRPRRVAAAGLAAAPWRRSRSSSLRSWRGSQRRRAIHENELPTRVTRQRRVWPPHCRSRRLPALRPTIRRLPSRCPPSRRSPTGRGPSRGDGTADAAGTRGLGRRWRRLAPGRPTLPSAYPRRHLEPATKPFRHPPGSRPQIRGPATRRRHSPRTRSPGVLRRGPPKPGRVPQPRTRRSRPGRPRCRRPRRRRPPRRVLPTRKWRPRQ